MTLISGDVNNANNKDLRSLIMKGLKFRELRSGLVILYIKLKSSDAY